MAWRVFPPGRRNQYGAECEACGGWCLPGDGTVYRGEGGAFVVDHMDCTGKDLDERPHQNRRHRPEYISAFGLAPDGINGDELRDDNAGYPY